LSVKQERFHLRKFGIVFRIIPLQGIGTPQNLPLCKNGVLKELKLQSKSIGCGPKNNG
jgi:hypothetical protein